MNNTTKKRPNGYWNEQTCYQEAKNYNSRSEFQKGNVSAYNVACKNGWLDNYTWFSEKKQPSGYWNYETCYQEALNYKSRIEFKKGCRSAYQVALKNGWLDNYTWFIEKCKPNGYWNYETCYQEAKNYNSRSEFAKGCSGAYQVACKKGWLDNYNWFISYNELHKTIHTKWTEQTCYQEALKYNSRSEFAKGCSGAYQVACKKGWLDNYTWFITKQKPSGYWKIYENNYNEAKKYKSRSEFAKGCDSAYQVARKNGWLDRFFPKGK